MSSFMGPRYPNGGGSNTANLPDDGTRKERAGPERPLEPLAPSPYASVIYSAFRTRSKVVPSALRFSGRGGAFRRTVRGCVGLAPSKTQELRLGKPPRSFDPAAARDRGETSKVHQQCVNQDEKACGATIRRIAAGSGDRMADGPKTARVTKKDRRDLIGLGQAFDQHHCHGGNTMAGRRLPTGTSRHAEQTKPDGEMRTPPVAVRAAIAGLAGEIAHGARYGGGGQRQADPGRRGW